MSVGADNAGTVAASGSVLAVTADAARLIFFLAALSGLCVCNGQGDDCDYECFHGRSWPTTRFCSQVQGIDAHIHTAILLTRVSRTVVGIGKLAADSELADVAQRDILLYGQVANDAIRPAPGKVEIVGLATCTVGDSFDLEDEIVHLTRVGDSLIQLFLRLFGQSALADFEVDGELVREFVIVEILQR